MGVTRDAAMDTWSRHASAINNLLMQVGTAGRRRDCHPAAPPLSL